MNHLRRQEGGLAVSADLTIHPNIPAPAEEALRALEAAGFEGFLVGGCVRDLLRGDAPNDWDITTNALPQQVEAVFSGARVIETGLKHGTVTVLQDGMPLEITTYRIDRGYSDSRHPDRVEFSARLEDDLSRRDFTVNAMAWSPTRGLVDCCGGREDLRAGVLRCVGDPMARFSEDALRILRLLRFSARLGFAVEEKTAAAALALREKLRLVSAERIQKELTGLLCAPDSARVLTEFFDILTVPLPELLPCHGFEQHHPRHAYDVWTHCVKTAQAVPATPALRWAALLHDVGKPDCFTLDAEGVGHFYGHAKRSVVLAEQILDRLRFDRRTEDRILRLIEAHDLPLQYPPEQEERAVRRLLGRLGEEEFFLLLALKRADTVGQGVPHPTRLELFSHIEALARALLSAHTCLTLRELAVSGDDLLALGMQEGPAVGEMLHRLLEAVTDGTIENTPEALRQAALGDLQESKRKQ